MSGDQTQFSSEFSYAFIRECHRFIRNQQKIKQSVNEPIPHVKKRFCASQKRQMLTARQIQELPKNHELVFLDIIISIQGAHKKRGNRGGKNRRSPTHPQFFQQRIVLHKVFKKLIKILDQKQGYCFIG